MTKDKFKHLGKMKVDNREQCGLWAPGKYMCKCRKCGDTFIGDKRAHYCADCAYSLEEETK